MKRILYAASALALLISVTFATNAAVAQVRPAAKSMMHLAICSSTPFGVPALQQLSQGIRNGVTLSIKHYASQLKKVGVAIHQVTYDYAKADHSTYDPTIAGTNARDCLNLSNSIGMVGTLNSGAELVAEPIENKGHLATVSPANTNPALSSVKPIDSSGGRVAQEPCSPHGASSCPKSSRISTVTFFRTVTTDKLQGPAGALFAKSKAHAKSFYIVDDGLTYGVGLATFFKAEAKHLGMKQLGQARIDTNNESTSQQQIAQNILALNPPPDVIYCGCDSETSTALPRNLRAGGFNKPYMGGDALFNSAWLTTKTGAGPGAVNNDVTSVGPGVSKASKFFTKLYNKDLHKFFEHPGPQAYDAPSYDAASSILLAVWHAAKAHQLKGSVKNMRTVVAKWVAKTNFTGATGKVSYDKDGDTKNKIVSVYHTVMSGGKLSWKFNYQAKLTGSPT